MDIKNLKGCSGLSVLRKYIIIFAESVFLAAWAPEGHEGQSYRQDPVALGCKDPSFLKINPFWQIKASI